MANILVVDDSPGISSLLALALRTDEKKHKIEIASTGEGALHLAKSWLPDLILLDVNLPDLTGFEVAEQLQADEATRLIPIIFVTARSDIDDRVHGLDLGANYVVKPFAVPELLARVRVALRLQPPKGE